MVETAAEAARLVEETKYAPLGRRGFSGATREARYGSRTSEEVAELGNRDTLLVVQLETARAVANAAEVAAVPGVDVVFVGPADLAQSMRPGAAGGESHRSPLAGDAAPHVRRLSPARAGGELGLLGRAGPGSGAPKASPTSSAELPRRSARRSGASAPTSRTPSPWKPQQVLRSSASASKQRIPHMSLASPIDLPNSPRPLECSTARAARHHRLGRGHGRAGPRPALPAGRPRPRALRPPRSPPETSSSGTTGRPGAPQLRVYLDQFEQQYPGTKVLDQDATAARRAGPR